MSELVNNKTNQMQQQLDVYFLIDSHVLGIIMPIIRRTTRRLFRTVCGDACLCWLWSCGAGT
jgi:hypothetical protein